MLSKHLFSLFLILLPTIFYAQSSEAPLIDSQLQDVEIDVVFLASDYLRGRKTGTEGEEKAAQYIARRFLDLGLTPKGTDGSWFQSFPWAEKKNPHLNTEENLSKGDGKNVVAYLDKGAATTIIIGAHYDHLGMDGSGSLHTGTPAIHNGADDNASGIAAMLMMAEILKDQPAKNNFLFIAFSGEELGLFGSKFYADNPTIDLKQVNYMINMDMVGMLNKEKTIVINGAGTSPFWKTAFPKIKVDGIKVITNDSGIGPSDHTSFYLKDIPSLHFFTGVHEHYHKPSDDTEFLNFPGIVSIANYILALVELSEKENSRITFTETKEENDGKKVSAFKVTLGVMPDYVYSGKGMRIDGVIGGRVADAAGLKKGDVVIKLGDLEVGDIYDYMEALAKYEKGDRAKIIVKRGEKELIKKVVF